MLSQLGGIPSPRAADAALIVSELVTNSVVHAGADIDGELVVELVGLGDRLQIAVVDSGSELEPCMVPLDPAIPGGFGLRLVDNMCPAWGFTREETGATRVWCELSLAAA